MSTSNTGTRPRRTNGCLTTRRSRPDWLKKTKKRRDYKNSTTKPTVIYLLLQLSSNSLAERLKVTHKLINLIMMSTISLSRTKNSKE
jgi:hypothetical protein